MKAEFVSCSFFPSENQIKLSIVFTCQCLNRFFRYKFIYRLPYRCVRFMKRTRIIIIAIF